MAGRVITNATFVLILTIAFACAFAFVITTKVIILTTKVIILTTKVRNAKQM